MRRATDKLSVACAVVCIVAVAVIAFVIAPATLDNSADVATQGTTQREQAKRQRQLDAQNHRIVKATKENCTRIHTLVATLDQLIASGRAQARAYERDGTITPRQLRRALRENQKSRATLGEADCPPRVAP